MKVITNCIILTGDDIVSDKNILIKNHKIIGIDAVIPDNAEIIDLNGQYIAPAFIDIQLNGGTTKYFSKTPNTETLQEMEAAAAQYGTGYFLPTLISSPDEKIIEAIAAVGDYMKTGNSVVGMHLEGPYLNPEKRGAHNIDIVRKPTDAALQQIIQHGEGVIKIMTIAPECFTDYQLDMLLESGIILSAGHSMMTYKQAQYYFDKGIHLVTHLYNAMTQMGHREPGTVGAVFDNPNVYAPIILDGGHCSYAAARIAYKQKGNKLILLTDASFLGRQKTEFNWDVLSLKMQDGFYRNPEGNLAGAAISMPEAVQNAITHLNISLQEAVAMASSRVAKAINMETYIGFIKPGFTAKFVVFNELGDVALLSV
ncbi:MAG: N-acetylglucosamine-6-phosphate deacetylase [Niabella sp.]